MHVLQDNKLPFEAAESFSKMETQYAICLQLIHQQFYQNLLLKIKNGTKTFLMKHQKTSNLNLKIRLSEAVNMSNGNNNLQVLIKYNHLIINKLNACNEHFF